jgi:hypothetical protein
MDNTGPWWDNLEVLKGVLTPFEELESLVVSIEFDLLIVVKSSWVSRIIDLDGVINDKVDWDLRVDLHWVDSEVGDSVSHGSEINDGWNSGEILEEHSSWLERNFDVSGVVVGPVEDVFDVLLSDGEVVTVSDGRLEENSDGVRESFNSIVSELVQRVKFVSSSTNSKLCLQTVEWIA